MTRSSFGWFVVGVAVLWMPSWAMAGAEADYKTLFGEDEEKAFVSEDPKVSAHFAAKLLNAARGVGKEEHLQILLCEKAYEFGMKEYSGYQTAMEAMKFLPKIAPDKRTQAQEKFLEAGQLRLAKSTGADRQALGGEMVDLLVVCGDERAAAKKPADAVGLYRKALSIATESGADRTRQIMEKIKQASSILDAEGRLEGLKNKLNENPKSIAARTSLILAYLGEFDAPAEAVKLLNNDLEEKFRTYVPLSVKPVADLEVGVCLELATWYMEIAERATADGKCMLLGKSKACCERYLELHTDQDTPRLKGTMLLEKITKAAEKAAPEFSKTLTLDLGKGIAMKLVLIPAGKFMMGSPETEKDRDANEGPQRAAAITKTFYMGACEVTQEQFQAVMGKNPSTFKGAKNPVAMISWGDAVDFCKALSSKAGKPVRLPTEAEWEYCCRAGTNTRFGFGDKDTDLGNYAWYDANSGRKAHPVAQKKPNAWGLYDMHGNVWEWCGDWYAESYEDAGGCDPQGATSGTTRVQRGGGWFNIPRICRSASRDRLIPGYRDDNGGFRVAVDSN